MNYVNVWLEFQGTATCIKHNILREQLNSVFISHIKVICDSYELALRNPENQIAPIHQRILDCESALDFLNENDPDSITLIDYKLYTNTDVALVEN